MSLYAFQGHKEWLERVSFIVSLSFVNLIDSLESTAPPVAIAKP